MSLPKRNLFIRLLYGLSIIGMFAFMVWIAWPANNYFSDVAAADTAKHNGEKSTATHVRPASVLADTTETDQLTEDNQLLIAGLGQTINLNANIEKQIGQHWEKFARLNISRQMTAKDPLQVVAVYHQYDNQRNQFRLTLGYRTTKAVATEGLLDTVKLSNGAYLKRPDASVLDYWQAPEKTQQRLKLEADYEEYQLDEQYQILSQTAFLAVQ